MYTPAVNVHANWRGKGEQVVITLVCPHQGPAPKINGVVDRSGDGAHGFDVSLADGRSVSYRAAVDHALLNAAGVQADAVSLLVVSDTAGWKAGVVMGARSFGGRLAEKPDFEFERAGAEQLPKVTPINVPTGFRWTGSADQLIPAYTAGP